MFNLTNWQLYGDVLGIEQSKIIAFVVPFSLIVGLVILLLLLIELKEKRNLKYFLTGLLALAVSYPSLSSFAPGAKIDSLLGQYSYPIAAVLIGLLVMYAALRSSRKTTTLPGIALFTPLIPLIFVLVFHWEIIPAFMLGITYGVLTSWKSDSINVLTRSILDGTANVIPAVLLMMGIGMLISAVMDQHVADALLPIMQMCVPTHALTYVLGFGCFSFLALYRGPLSLWGMGSGLVSLAQKATALSSQAIMAMLMSVGQIQGICDPTNTANIWIATYLGVDTQVILKRTIPYALLCVFLGLSLAVAKGFVPW
jgi:hypothetical protein